MAKKIINLTLLIFTLMMTSLIPSGFAYGSTSESIFLSTQTGIDSIEVNGEGRQRFTNQPNSVLSPNGKEVLYTEECDLYITATNGSDESTARNVTNSPGFCESMGVWSPQGDRLLFYSEDLNSGQLDLATIDYSGTISRTIRTNVVNSGFPSWSPDGNRVTFTTDTVDNNGSGYSEVGLIDINSSEEIIIAHETNYSLREPMWSPDGTKIAVLMHAHATISPTYSTTLSVIDLSTFSRTSLYSSSGYGDSLDYPIWSPNSGSILVTESTFNQADRQLHFRIIGIPVSGGSVEEIYNAGIESLFASQWLLISSINDVLAPELFDFTLSNNPKSVNESSTVSISVHDTQSTISQVEYFIGDTDPGQGSGIIMNLSNIQDGGKSADATAAIDTDLLTGMYAVNIRAQDSSGNWSETMTDYLVVYNPDGPKFTGKRTVIPSLANDDVLPGLTTVNQADKAKFDFSVKYNNLGEIASNSNFQLAYNTGAHCNNPRKATNCHTFELNATSISWLTTIGSNSSVGIFQGIASLVVDGQNSTALFRVTAADGKRLSPISTDQFQVMVFEESANPNIDTPIYKINSVNITRGNIKVQD